MKKILLALVTITSVTIGVVGLSAFEAHIVNVTAKIENALSVEPKELKFGTVFPEEYFTKEFIIKLSNSFLDGNQTRLKDVMYKIEQKPKCIDSQGKYVQCVPNLAGQCVCPTNTTKMLDLCKFLSKLPKVQESGDIGHPSYYIDNPPEGPSPNDSCATPTPSVASGRLDKSLSDTQDKWIVDLKVPPVAGYVGQDWPASCADYIVPTDGANYGCDLWIEVTGFSKFDCGGSPCG